MMFMKTIDDKIKNKFLFGKITQTKTRDYQFFGLHTHVIAIIT